MESTKTPVIKYFLFSLLILFISPLFLTKSVGSWYSIYEEVYPNHNLLYSNQILEFSILSVFIFVLGLVGLLISKKASNLNFSKYFFINLLVAFFSFIATFLITSYYSDFVKTTFGIDSRHGGLHLSQEIVGTGAISFYISIFILVFLLASYFLKRINTSILIILVLISMAAPFYAVANIKHNISEMIIGYNSYHCSDLFGRIMANSPTTEISRYLSDYYGDYENILEGTDEWIDLCSENLDDHLQTASWLTRDHLRGFSFNDIVSDADITSEKEKIKNWFRSHE